MPSLAMAAATVALDRIRSSSEIQRALMVRILVRFAPLVGFDAEFIADQRQLTSQSHLTIIYTVWRA